MFRKPRVNVIESDEGFSVEVLGRTGLLYTEGVKKIRIDSEVLNSSEIGVVRESIKAWNPPHNDEIIDANKRATIIENVCQAFKWDGVNIAFF